MTAEQQARDLLEQMGVGNAQSFTAGDLVELANLIAAYQMLTVNNERLMRQLDEANKRIEYLELNR